MSYIRVALLSLYSISAAADDTRNKGDEIEQIDLWAALNECITSKCADEQLAGRSSVCFQQVCSAEAGACLKDEVCRLKATHGETLDTVETSSSYGLVKKDLMVCVTANCPSFDTECLVRFCGFSLSKCLFAKDCLVSTYCLSTCQIEKCADGRPPQDCLPIMQCVDNCMQDTTVAKDAKIALENLLTEEKKEKEMHSALPSAEPSAPINAGDIVHHDKDHFDVSDQVMSCVLHNCPSVNPSVKCLVSKCLGKILKCTFSGLCLKMGYCSLGCMKPVFKNEAVMTKLDAVIKCTGKTQCLDTMPPSFVCVGLYCSAEAMPCVLDKECISAMNCMMNCLPEDKRPTDEPTSGRHPLTLLNFLKELPRSKKEVGSSEDMKTVTEITE